MRKSIKIRMIKKDLLVPDLAKEIGRTEQYISNAFNNKTKLRIDEAFIIGDMLDMTADEVRTELAGM